MGRVFVSLIINNYNYGHFLQQAIDSCIHQTFSSIEVIVVDDGSTDHSQSIIASYGDRIISLLKSNGGQASALNAGFRISQGEIVIFLDADDYLFPHAVEQVVAVWQSHLAQVQYRLNLIDGQGRYVDLMPAKDLAFDNGVVFPILLERGRQQTTVTSGNAFSRHALTHLLPIPEAEFRISADGYLVTLIPFYGQVTSIEQPLGAYRQHGANRWSVSGSTVPVERFRQAVIHDFHRYQALRAKAAELCYPVSQKVDANDHLHLTYRLASLRLDPVRHPVPADRSVRLARRGIWAIWRYSQLRGWRRLGISLWFLWVGLMPKGLAEPVIIWRLVAAARPQPIVRFLKWGRSQLTASVPSPPSLPMQPVDVAAVPSSHKKSDGFSSRNVDR